jgi:hypothetical protein
MASTNLLELASLIHRLFQATQKTEREEIEGKLKVLGKRRPKFFIREANASLNRSHPRTLGIRTILNLLPL